MIKPPHFPKSRPSNRRLKILFGILFVLLSIHFILVYTCSSWLGIYHVISSGEGIDPSISTHQRIIEKDGKRYLWGGAEENQHFDITEFRLNPNQLHYGIGRENFPALIEPEFVPAEESEQWPWLDDYQRVLVVKIGDEVKVYPIELLIRHEVVNDVIGGRSIFAAYCILADLGAVYDRHIDGHVLTFALSGYTYAIRNIWGGRDAFVLWDRETESLWWPPIGRAVSGPYIDIPLKILEKNLWAQTTWGKIKDKYSDVKVLKPGQDFERPANWQRLPVPSQKSIPEKLPDDAIAPRWGENQGLFFR